jgi:hypothetical protein
MGDFHPELHVNGVCVFKRMAEASSSNRATSNALDSCIFTAAMREK